jgi:hypothetical protein
VLLSIVVSLHHRRSLSLRDPGRWSSSPHYLSLSLSNTRTMSSRRSRASTVSEEEINELISRLQTLLPSARRRGGSQV